MEHFQLKYIIPAIQSFTFIVPILFNSLAIVWSSTTTTLSNRNYFTAFSSKGKTSSSQEYEKVMVDSFSDSKTEQVSTEGSCAILCLKAKCKSFRLVLDDGNLMCSFGASGTPSESASAIAVYEKPLSIIFVNIQ
jgi:hypothetical protein